ncbi:type II toxin-antitoxin system HicB family antitoxin [Methylobacterium sp. J-072]|uniref:type II toxin-antitoxin system HicB family antitoxin n=1 Tax=Methylobacterium sp. J-072 TaxID=2836651 RepID=UPI001FB9C942|nr:type II toxin-antitoxin system HicB family antitoxin [Methylobacterium sp. J-072]MCJ2091038.1 type II toxin-antitoxin system HicB family antitoxin [Methylobacterium sp. J-072]
MTGYIFDLEPDDNGTYLTTCAAFPEITTYVEDPAALPVHGLGALEEALAARIARNEDIPAPAPVEAVKGPDARDGRVIRTWVKLPLQTDLKVMLYRMLRSKGITRAELQRQLGWNRESVDRLFRLDHQTRTAQFDAAYRALGYELSVQSVPVA